VTEKHKTGKGISGKAVASLRKHAIANKFLVRTCREREFITNHEIFESITFFNDQDSN